MKDKTVVVNPTRNRNYGIDLLRLISMLMVVVLHVLGQGGVLKNVQALSLQGEALWFLQITCYCAVNVFAIISGLVGLKSKHKYSSLINLCIQLMFYAAIITGIELIISISTHADISLKNTILHLFPSIRSMWYFSAYFCLFFFMPLLNLIIENAPRRTLQLCAGFIFVVWCCFGQISSTVAHLDYGYSVLWLAILYLLGAYLTKYDPLKNLSCVKCIFGFWICVVLTGLSRIAIGYIVPSAINLLISYTSPTIVLAAVFLVYTFKKIQFKDTATKIISFLSPMAFGVYLIHCHPYIYDNLYGKFSAIASMPVYYAPLVAIAIAFAIFTICLLIDWLRILLFKVCKTKDFSIWLEKLFSKVAVYFLKLFHINTTEE